MDWISRRCTTFLNAPTRRCAVLYTRFQTIRCRSGAGLRSQNVVNLSPRFISGIICSEIANKMAKLNLSPKCTRPEDGLYLSSRTSLAGGVDRPRPLREGQSSLGRSTCGGEQPLNIIFNFIRKLFENSFRQAMSHNARLGSHVGLYFMRHCLHNSPKIARQNEFAKRSIPRLNLWRLGGCLTV